MIGINVFAENRGWLFEDLKQHFTTLPSDELDITVSDRPHQDADTWVALRTREAGASPDLGRTVVCIHDLLDEASWYRLGGDREGVRAAGGLALSHPDQRRMLISSQVSLRNVALLERPLGALSIFAPRRRLPEAFTVGWVSRNHPRKRLSWFGEALSQLAARGHAARVSLVGSEMEPATHPTLAETAARLERGGVECRIYRKQEHTIADYPSLYRELDCLVVTSATEAGPLPLFEALATGLPVISTPVGWAPQLAARAPSFVRLAESPSEIARRLDELRLDREWLFSRRFEIAELVAEWRLESWLREVAELAGSLAAANGKNRSARARPVSSAPAHREASR